MVMAKQLTELCIILVDEIFGDIAAHVWTFLAEHGRATARDIVQISGVSLQELTPILPILINHRVVVHYTDAEFQETYYSADLAGTYNLVRLSRIEGVARKRCGREAGHIISTVAQYGCVSVGDLVKTYQLDKAERDLQNYRNEGPHDINGADALSSETVQAQSEIDDRLNGHTEVGAGADSDQFEAQGQKDREHDGSRNKDKQKERNKSNGYAEKDDVNVIDKTPGSASVVAKEKINKTQQQKSKLPFKTSKQVYSAIYQLLEDKFLIRSHDRITQTDYDTQAELEQEVIEESFPDKKVTGPKASKMFERLVNARKRKQHEADEEYESPHARPVKRRKVNGTSNGYHAVDNYPETLDDDLIVTVNFRKYVLALRSHRLESLSAQRLGESASTIYGALLRTLEVDIRDVKDNRQENRVDDEDDEDYKYDLPQATAAKIMTNMHTSFDMTSSLKISTKDVPTAMPNGVKRQRVEHVDEDLSVIGIKQELNSDDEGDDGRDEISSFQNRAKMFEMIDKHLASLEEHPFTFCQKASRGTPTEWQVPFHDITQKLVLEAIDDTITARFGSMATRLVRMLREKGKLEEKQVATSSFLKMKDVRSNLAELYGHGFIEAQELAKDNTRQPAKALYLWYFDTQKVQRMLLHQCYQSMSRAYQRLAHERSKYKNILRKLEDLNENRISYHDSDEEDEKNKGPQIIMYDIKMNNDRLGSYEQKMMREWKEKESALIGQILRLDDMVILLRDFGAEFMPVTS